jgi:hypothetical protein
MQGKAVAFCTAYNVSNVLLSRNCKTLQGKLLSLKEATISVERSVIFITLTRLLYIFISVFSGFAGRLAV